MRAASVSNAVVNLTIVSAREPFSIFQHPIPRQPGRREAAGGHYPRLAEWALGSGESVVSFPCFITELLTFPPRLTRAADFLWTFSPQYKAREAAG
jgi:hypothetical protein